MQTVIVEISNKSALKALHGLEEKQLIRIIKEDDLDSPALPGKAQSLAEFRNWLKGAESTPTISLKDAKTAWAGKRKQLQKLSK